MDNAILLPASEKDGLESLVLKDAKCFEVLTSKLSSLETLFEDSKANAVINNEFFFSNAFGTQYYNNYSRINP